MTDAQVQRLAAIREADARWEPRCQYIKGSLQSSGGHGNSGRRHPWPLSVAQADAYGLLCGVRASDHPARFVGPQWDHDAIAYDPAQDPDPRAAVRFLLSVLDAPAIDDASYVPLGSTREAPGG